MDHLKIIKTPEEHEAALERLMALMEADPQEGSREADELEVLAMLIEQYEQRDRVETDGDRLPAPEHNQRARAQYENRNQEEASRTRENQAE